MKKISILAFCILGTATAWSGGGGKAVIEYLTPPAKPKSRIGYVGTGSFGAKAKFISDAYVGKVVQMAEGDAYDPAMHGEYTHEEEDAVSPGVELFYERELGQFARGLRMGRASSWGVRAAFGYSRYEMEHQESLGDWVPGLAVNSEFAADLLYFSVGPYAEIPLSERWDFQVGAGVTAAHIRGKLGLSEGSYGLGASDEDFLFGAYAMAGLSYRFNDRWSFAGGIRYHYLESFSIDAPGGDGVDLDFGGQFQVYTGLRLIY